MYLNKTPFKTLGSPSQDQLTEYAQIYTPNKLVSRVLDFEKDYGNMTISSETGTAHEMEKMFDRDHDTYWLSSGSDDSTTETLEVIFYEGTSQLSQEFDSILIIGNLKKFTLQYKDAFDVWQNIPELVITDNNEGIFYKEFAPKESYKIQLLMYETISADMEKQIFEIYLMKRIFKFQDGFDSYLPRNIEKGGSFRLSNGDRKRWQVAEKYTCRFSQELISQNELDDYKDLYDDYDEFLWYPEPEDKPDKIYLVQWVNLWSDPYTTKYKGAGYTLNVELEEV